MGTYKLGIAFFALKGSFEITLKAVPLNHKLKAVLINHNLKTVPLNHKLKTVTLTISLKQSL